MRACRKIIGGCFDLSGAAAGGCQHEGTSDPSEHLRQIGVTTIKQLENLMPFLIRFI